MWYAWANTTQIGYVRQSDRKMVNLGRISGEIENWDGETGFVSYGQMSVEQAVWYQGQSRADYRAFYPGPPSNPADEYGRYIGSIISASKSSTPGSREVFIPGTNISTEEFLSLTPEMQEDLLGPTPQLGKLEPRRGDWQRTEQGTFIVWNGKQWIERGVFATGNRKPFVGEINEYLDRDKVRRKF